MEAFVGMKAGVAYNTFDLLVLTNAGKAALDVQSGKIEAVVKDIQKDHPRADAKDIRDRLEQPFFANQAFQITMFLFLFVGFAIATIAFAVWVAYLVRE